MSSHICGMNYIPQKVWKPYLLNSYHRYETRSMKIILFWYELHTLLFAVYSIALPWCHLRSCCDQGPGDGGPHSIARASSYIFVYLVVHIVPPLVRHKHPITILSCKWISFDMACSGERGVELWLYSCFIRWTLETFMYQGGHHLDMWRMKSAVNMLNCGNTAAGG